MTTDGEETATIVANVTIPGTTEIEEAEIETQKKDPTGVTIEIPTKEMNDVNEAEAAAENEQSIVVEEIVLDLGLRIRNAVKVARVVSIVQTNHSVKRPLAVNNKEKAIIMNSNLSRRMNQQQNQQLLKKKMYQ